MALASEGSQVLDEVWTEIVDFIPKKEQEDLALKLVKIFEDHDVDGIQKDSDYVILRKASRDLAGDVDENDDEAE